MARRPEIFHILTFYVWVRSVVIGLLNTDDCGGYDYYSSVQESNQHKHFALSFPCKMLQINNINLERGICLFLFVIRLVLLTTLKFLLGWLSFPLHAVMGGMARLRCQVLSLPTLNSWRGAFGWLLDGLPKLWLLKWGLKAEKPHCSGLAPLWHRRTASAVRCGPWLLHPAFPLWAARFFRLSLILWSLNVCMANVLCLSYSESVSVAYNRGSPLHAT